MNRRLLLGCFVLLGAGTTHADDAAEAGAALFRRSCAVCHGPDGRAATPAAKRLGARDLSMSTLTDDQVRTVIVEGMRGARSAMPGFGTKFSPEELDALVAHLRNLRESQNGAKP